MKKWVKEENNVCVEGKDVEPRWEYFHVLEILSREDEDEENVLRVNRVTGINF